jgi:hypothetical protein
MALDRQKTQKIVQALIRAKSRRNEEDVVENIRQAGTASGDRNQGDSVLGRMGLASTPKPGVITGSDAAGQSHKLISTPPLHPFRDLAEFSYPDAADDMAKARGIPARGLLAFNEASGASSRPANPQTPYGRPLAANAVGPLQQKYWGYLWDDLFPSYCKTPDEVLTFPPLAKELSEADKEVCRKTHDSDRDNCYENHSYKPDALRGCRERADTNRDLCLRGEKELPPWSDVDADGIRLPQPPARGKKKK